MRKYIFLLFIALLFQQHALFGQLDSTNIPLFIINTKGVSIMDEPKIPADLKIIFQDGQYNHPEDPGNIYEGNIGIEIRGRYSASLPQTPYGIETRDLLGENLNVPLFHMPPENDWILLANYNDKTFLRNALAFELFRKMGHYAPRTQFCEVIVNTWYQGIYVFTEKIKRDQGRVDIATLNPDEVSADDVAGGYIIKIDYYNDSDSWQSSFPPLGYADKKVHFVYHYPKPDDINEAQKAYISEFINDFEETLYSPNTADRNRKLYDLIDVGSFIDYFVIGELSRNVDAYKKSSYFHKDKNGKLHAGPVWDFDWAWKNINECFFGATDGSGFAYKVHQCNPWPVPPTWMSRLLDDPYFTQELSQRYDELRGSYLSEDYIFHYIDSVAEVLDDAQKRHYQRWPILGRNVGAPEVDEQPLTYAGEIQKFKNWISTRLNWLDQQLPKFVVTDIPDFVAYEKNMLFPNPATDRLTIRSDALLKSYAIYSADGKMMLSGGTNAKEVTINLVDLLPGLYMIRIQNQDGSSWNGKFVKAAGD